MWEKLGQGDHIIYVKPSFSKNFVFKLFSVHTKTKTSDSRRISGPNRRNKAAFSNSSGVLWTLP